MLKRRHGEQLGLTLWIAVPLEGPEGTPAALWGLGGRDGGPSGPVRGSDARARRRRPELI
jgi:hypothetical protein